MLKIKIKKILEIKCKLEKSEDKYFEMRNSIVFRKNKNLLLFYVYIIFKYHDDFGHMGVDKVFEIISKSYWFPELKKKITEHIKSCYKCIAFNRSTGKIEGFIHNIPKGNKPFEILHIDHTSIPDITVKNKKYIFVITDAFTKFVKLFPTKTVSSKETIVYLREYFAMYSKPRVLISDRSTCFTS